MADENEQVEGGEVEQPQVDPQKAGGGSMLDEGGDSAGRPVPADKKAATPAAERARDEHGRFVPKPEGMFDKTVESMLNLRDEAVSSPIPAPPGFDKEGEAKGEGEEKPAKPAKTEQQKQPADAQSPSAEAAAKPSEGPSASLRAVAKVVGLPQDVIDLAVNDDQLTAFINKADRFQAPAPQRQQQPQRQAEPAPAAPAPLEPLAKLLLPDEDFPEGDPHRAQAAHFAESLNSFRDEVAQVLEHLFTWKEGQEQARQVQASATKQQRFDSLVDALGHDMFGSKAEIKSQDEPAFKARAYVFHEYESLMERVPDMDPDIALQWAIKKTFGELPKQQSASPQQQINPAKREALLKQSNSRLGGLNSGPSTREPEQPNGHRFDQIASAFLAGRR